MHSANHYRDRAAQIRQLAANLSHPALQEQLEIVASDYHQIVNESDT